MSGRNNSKIFFILGVILAVLAGVLVRGYLLAIPEPEQVETVAVVVAAVDIPAGVIISEEMLATSDRRAVDVDGTMYTEISDLTEQNLTTSAPILAGSAIHRSLIAPNYGLEIGYRAVGVAVSAEQSVGQNVRPGNRVDIAVAYTYADDTALTTLNTLNNRIRNDGSAVFNEAFQIEVIEQLGELSRQLGNTERATEIILQNVPVLAVNSNIPTLARPEAAGENVITSDEISRALGSDIIVTVALTPEDAQKLIFARQFGDSLSLLIRRPDDTSTAPISALPTFLEPLQAQE